MNKCFSFLVIFFLLLQSSSLVNASTSLGYVKELPSIEQSVVGVNHGRYYLEHYGVQWARNTSSGFDPTSYEVIVIGHDDFPEIPTEQELEAFLVKYLEDHPQALFFEFWNEMNTSWSFPATCPGDPNRSGFVCFKKSAEEYTKLLKVFYETLKRERPESTVILGSLADSWPGKYLGFIYEAGGKDFFDIVAFNPEYVKLPDASRTKNQKYPEIAAAPELKGDIYRRGTRAKIQAVSKVMDEHEDEHKSLWIGETGYSLEGQRAFVDSESQQIAYQVRSMILSFSQEKVERYFLYRWGSGGIEGQFEVAHDTYRALATLAPLFSGYDFVSSKEGGDSYDFLFEEKNGPGQIHFMWALKEGTNYQSPEADFQAHSIYGEKIPKPPTLSPEPIIFVKNAELKKIQLSDESIWFYDQVLDPLEKEQFFSDLSRKVKCGEIEDITRIEHMPFYDYETFWLFDDAEDRECTVGDVLLSFFTTHHAKNHWNGDTWEKSAIPEEELQKIPEEIQEQYFSKWDQKISMNDFHRLFVIQLMKKEKESLSIKKALGRDIGSMENDIKLYRLFDYSPTRLQRDILREDLKQSLAKESLLQDIRWEDNKEEILYLVERGIISGYPDGNFRPQKTINRAEALKLIFESLGIDIEEDVESGFPDVEKDQWYAKYVTQAKKRGLISGYPDGSYRPAQPVKIVEFIKMAMSAQASYAAQDKDISRIKYEDLEVDQWYIPFVSFAVEQGFLKKRIRLKPGEDMTRSEAAYIIAQIDQKNSL